MSEMEELGVSQYYEKQAIDSGTTYGKGMLHMAAVFAELERDVIRDRVIASMERAKATGTKSGKAIGRPKVGAQAEAAIRASLLAGNGILKTAKLWGVSNGPVKRIKAAMANA
jgi:DNA invertase Pin-like site-specific DNA recombinase